MRFIRSAFLHCVFSNASSNCLPRWMYIDTGCIVLPSLHGVFSNVPTNCLTVRIQYHLGCIYVAFLHYGFSNVPTNCLPARIQKHTSYIHLAFFHFRLFKCAHKLPGGEDKTSQELRMLSLSLFIQGQL